MELPHGGSGCSGSCAVTVRRPARTTAHSGHAAKVRSRSRSQPSAQLCKANDTNRNRSRSQRSAVQRAPSPRLLVPSSLTVCAQLIDSAWSLACSILSPSTLSLPPFLPFPPISSQCLRCTRPRPPTPSPPRIGPPHDHSDGFVLICSIATLSFQNKHVHSQLAGLSTAEPTASAWARTRTARSPGLHSGARTPSPAEDVPKPGSGGSSRKAGAGAGAAAKK